MAPARQCGRGLEDAASEGDRIELNARVQLQLSDVYSRLLGRYGPQHWWPAKTAFEIMVGAVLTQATAWTNVEKAIANLERADVLTPEAIRALPSPELARLVYPSGFFNAKARKLKALCEYLGRAHDDDIEAMSRLEAAALRDELLGVFGIGEETADAILLYALGHPAFVIDAYSRRTFGRLGLADASTSYADHQSLFTGNLPLDAGMFGEYHALIVRHGRETCKTRPLCAACPLLEVCPTGGLEEGQRFLPKTSATNTVRGEPVEPPGQRPSTGSVPIHRDNGHFHN
jgi:endonuclease-3 related protein